MPEVPYKDFQILDIRIGQVVEAEEVESSKNLLKLKVDFGSEQRQAVAGLKNYYKPEELVGKKFVFILNLEKRKIMGIKSECMIFAADDGKGNVVLLQPAEDVEIGSKIK